MTIGNVTNTIVKIFITETIGARGGPSLPRGLYRLVYRGKPCGRSGIGMTKFSKDTYRGEISDAELLSIIIETVKESPTINRKQLKDFGII